MYLTFDVGTTSVKAALFDSEGRPRAKSIQGYTLATPHADWVEADPGAYWAAVLAGFRECLAAPGVDPRQVRSICGSSQGETIVLLDERDRPVRPAMVWLDNRAREQAEALKARIDPEEFYRTTGCTDIEPTWSLLKVLWLKEHEPEALARAAKILLLEDYVVYLLTGRFCSTPTLLHSTGFLDIHARRYWSKTAGWAGVEGLLPEIVEAGSVVGPLKRELAGELGLPRDTIVVKGAMDQTLGNVGAGNIVPGIVAETTGTAMAIGVTAERVEGLQAHHLPYQPHVLPGRYLILPYAQTSAILYKWFRDRFGQEELARAGDPERAYEELNRLAAGAPPGCDGLLLLPFFAGAYTPENDMYARGAWYGLTLKHGKGHFARSIQESVAFMLRRILSMILAAGIPIREVRAMGGAARSDLWLQIKADACNLPMVRMHEEETAGLGCAMLCAVAAGDYRGLGEAAAAMVRPGRSFEPQPGNRAVYERMFALYGELYGALKPLFRKYAS